MSPQSVTGTALLFYMLMMFVPHRRHISPQPLTWKALLFIYVDDIRTPQETHVSIESYRESLTFYIC
jgi:hypothetical protein